MVNIDFKNSLTSIDEPARVKHNRKCTWYLKETEHRRYWQKRHVNWVGGILEGSVITWFG